MQWLIIYSTMTSQHYVWCSHWLQCGDSLLQEHQVPGLGPRGPDQHPAILAVLLSKHPGGGAAPANQLAGNDCALTLRGRTPGDAVAVGSMIPQSATWRSHTSCRSLHSRTATQKFTIPASHAHGGQVHVCVHRQPHGEASCSLQAGSKADLGAGPHA